VPKEPYDLEWYEESKEAELEGGEKSFLITDIAWYLAAGITPFPNEENGNEL